MSIDWHDLGTALALYFVLEGLLPFLSPAAAQRVFLAMSQAPPAQIRLIGVLSMAAGLILLFVVRG
jgi:uncharacterized protein YjeT (DUF2065 family)